MIKWLYLLLIFSFSKLNAINCEIIKELEKENVSIDAYKQALAYYKKNNSYRDYLTFIDFSLPSDKERMVIVDMKNNKIYKYKTAHGSGINNINKSAMIKSCKYKNKRTNFTRPGFYETIGLYSSKWGKRHKWKNIYKHFNGIKMVGLTEGVNDKIYDKGVVIHSTNYVKENEVKNSEGCFAVKHEDIKKISRKINRNALIYAYVPQCEEDFEKSLKEVKGWENICGYDEIEDKYYTKLDIVYKNKLNIVEKSLY